MSHHSSSHGVRILSSVLISASCDLLLEIGWIVFRMVDTMKRIAAEEGTMKLFSGIQPRVFWISIGGWVP